MVCFIIISYLRIRNTKIKIIPKILCGFPWKYYSCIQYESLPYEVKVFANFTALFNNLKQNEHNHLYLAFKSKKDEPKIVKALDLNFISFKLTLGLTTGKEELSKK